MKWSPRILPLLLVFSLTFSAPAHADNPLTKLARGAVNFVTSPVEYFVHGNLAYEPEAPLRAAYKTMGNGTLYFLVRLVAGVYEIVTFPIPIPWAYKSIIKPDTVEQSFNAAAAKRRAVESAYYT